MHENSRLMFTEFAAQFFEASLKVLEIGPDDFPSTYESACRERVTVWDTIDMKEDSRLTFQSTGEYNFPIPDKAYDIILSGNVMEHVRKPWIWIKEVARVCKLGGMVITLNPVSWSYHEAPIDCWRAYPEGMKALYEEGGLRVILCEWGSFETPGYRVYRPGVSVSYQPQTCKWRLARRFGPQFGLPVERAYDTITVGIKEIIAG